MDISWVFIVIQLIFLEGLLSIDNAAVLGAMVAPLPMDEPIPWPSWLQGIGNRLNPLLGGQQVAALKVGLLGAYLGRGLMLVIAHQIVRYPWLQLVGGAYLVYLGIEHLAASDGSESENGKAVAIHERPSFWGVVLTVELMDLVFSLDNVVAAVALADHLWVVLLGVALGILALRWAAGIFSVMVEKEPILQDAAYILVLVIGLRFCLEHFFAWEIHSGVQFGVSLAILGLALLYARWAPMRLFHPFVHRFRHMLHVGMTFIKGLLTFRSVVNAKTESSEGN
jgi:tellurite resistance protein TerC